ncbi:hypothetical protein D3C77_742460 [compost metagenome]
MLLGTKSPERRQRGSGIGASKLWREASRNDRELDLVMQMRMHGQVLAALFDYALGNILRYRGRDE